MQIGLAILLASLDLFASSVAAVIAILVTVATALLWRRFVFALNWEALLSDVDGAG